MLAVLFFGGLKLLVSDYMNCDEFKVYYEQNAEDFDYIAKELSQFSNDMTEDDKFYGSIKKVSVFKRMVDQGRYCEYIGKGLVIYPNISSNIDFKFDEIKKTDIKRLKDIFKNGKIKSVQIHKNHIRFYGKSLWKSSVCIIYSQDSPPFYDESWAVNYKHTPIADNWYCVQED